MLGGSCRPEGSFSDAPAQSAQRLQGISASSPLSGGTCDSGRARTDLGRVGPPGHVLGPHCLLDAIHLLLVALAVSHGVLLGLLQRALQGLDALCRGPQPFLQLG